MEIYQPAEDSYLLSDTIKQFIKENKPKKNIFILDMGSGSGIQAKTLKKIGFKNILAADINPDAIKHLKKQKLKAIKSNLFSNIKKNQRFNFIVFNPPYLPESKYDRQPDTTAGKKGYETIIRFLKQAKSHLTPDGTILLLFSSLTKPNIIKRQARKLGYKYRLLNEKNLFFEKLYVYEFDYL